MWHVSSRSGEACCELLGYIQLLYFTVSSVVRASDCVQSEFVRRLLTV